MTGRASLKGGQRERILGLKDARRPGEGDTPEPSRMNSGRIPALSGKSGAAALPRKQGGTAKVFFVPCAGMGVFF